MDHLREPVYTPHLYTRGGNAGPIGEGQQAELEEAGRARGGAWASPVPGALPTSNRAASAFLQADRRASPARRTGSSRVASPARGYRQPSPGRPATSQGTSLPAGSASSAYRPPSSGGTYSPSTGLPAGHPYLTVYTRKPEAAQSAYTAAPGSPSPTAARTTNLRASRYTLAPPAYGRISTGQYSYDPGTSSPTHHVAGWGSAARSASILEELATLSAGHMSPTTSGANGTYHQQGQPGDPQAYTWRGSTSMGQATGQQQTSRSGAAMDGRPFSGGSIGLSGVHGLGYGYGVPNAHASLPPPSPSKTATAKPTIPMRSNSARQADPHPSPLSQTSGMSQGDNSVGGQRRVATGGPRHTSPRIYQNVNRSPNTWGARSQTGRAGQVSPGPGEADGGARASRGRDHERASAALLRRFSTGSVAGHKWNPEDGSKLTAVPGTAIDRHAAAVMTAAVYGMGSPQPGTMLARPGTSSGVGRAALGNSLPSTFNGSSGGMMQLNGGGRMGEHTLTAVRPSSSIYNSTYATAFAAESQAELRGAGSSIMEHMHGAVYGNGGAEGSNMRDMRSTASRDSMGRDSVLSMGSHATAPDEPISPGGAHYYHGVQSSNGGSPATPTQEWQQHQRRPQSPQAPQQAQMSASRTGRFTSGLLSASAAIPLSNLSLSTAGHSTSSSLQAHPSSGATPTSQGQVQVGGLPQPTNQPGSQGSSPSVSASNAAPGWAAQEGWDAPSGAHPPGPQQYPGVHGHGPEGGTFSPRQSVHIPPISGATTQQPAHPPSPPMAPAGPHGTHGKTHGRPELVFSSSDSQSPSIIATALQPPHSSHPPRQPASPGGCHQESREQPVPLSPVVEAHATHAAWTVSKGVAAAPSGRSEVVGPPVSRQGVTTGQPGWTGSAGVAGSGAGRGGAVSAGGDAAARISARYASTAETARSTSATSTHYPSGTPRGATGDVRQSTATSQQSPAVAATGAAVSSANASTSPLLMFAGLASTRTPVHPNKLPAAVDEEGLLGGPMNQEHSLALPGYAVGRVIGEGGFCQVRLAVHRLSGRRVAVKVIDKMKLADANEARRIQREIRVMRHLVHETIIRLFEVVDSPTILYLVMEHAPSGSLLDHVRARKRLAEPDAAYVLQQVMAGLSYCHHREVVHRDIKLENILLDGDNAMKLIDFGLSAFFLPGKRLRVHCGSPSYAAPEIVARKQYDGPPVDVWSMGVVTFAMLCGFLPFHSSTGNKQELCSKIMEGKYTVPDTVSPLAKDMLSRMLTVDPDRRITLEQLATHPWVSSGASWEALGASMYMVRTDPSTGAVYADEQLVSELEAAGYPRSMILQYLLSADGNYLTAGYFLLAEGKSEVIRRMRGPAAARRYIARNAPGGGQGPAHAGGSSEPAAPSTPLTPTSQGRSQLTAHSTVVPANIQQGVYQTQAGQIIPVPDSGQPSRSRHVQSTQLVRTSYAQGEGGWSGSVGPAVAVV